MGKKRVGIISELVDSILKNVVDGKNIHDVHDLITMSVDYMKSDMNGNDTEYENLKNKIKDGYSNFIE